MPERVFAVIVAAGAATRMGDTDKIFATVGGRALLERAIAPFDALVDGIAVVLSAQNLERGRDLVAAAGFQRVAAVVEGGERRQDSVRAGLEALVSAGDGDIVLVHDGARPLVTPEMIGRAVVAVQAGSAAVPGLMPVDTIKGVGDDGAVTETLDRGRLRAIQTPQAFRYSLLMRAHREVTDDVTDDAAMIEALGERVTVFEGDRANIKITTPEDLRIAEALIGEGE